jgi:hypothetical protein
MRVRNGRRHQWLGWEMMVFKKEGNQYHKQLVDEMKYMVV